MGIYYSFHIHCVSQGLHAAVSQNSLGTASHGHVAHLRMQSAAMITPTAALMTSQYVTWRQEDAQRGQAQSPLLETILCNLCLCSTSSLP